MSLSTPSLYLNTDSLQNGDLNPFFASLLTTANAGPWARVSGAEGPLRVYPCTLPTDGTSVPVRTDFGTNTFHLIAKVDPADEDLVLEIDFTKTTDGDYFYYEANPAVLSVPQGSWLGEKFRKIPCDFEERDGSGDDSGAGATLGCFKGRTAGIGPVLGYIQPIGSEKLLFEVKWLPELDTKNRLNGDYVWLKMVYTF